MRETKCVSQGGNNRDVKVVRYTVHSERSTNRITDILDVACKSMGDSMALKPDEWQW